eukprot:507482-Rhodomonas_salina.2
MMLRDLESEARERIAAALHAVLSLAPLDVDFDVLDPCAHALSAAVRGNSDLGPDASLLFARGHSHREQRNAPRESRVRCSRRRGGGRGERSRGRGRGRGRKETVEHVDLLFREERPEPYQLCRSTIQSQYCKLPSQAVKTQYR